MIVCYMYETWSNYCVYLTFSLQQLLFHLHRMKCLPPLIFLQHHCSQTVTNPGNYIIRVLKSNHLDKCIDYCAAVILEVLAQDSAKNAQT